MGDPTDTEQGDGVTDCWKSKAAETGMTEKTPEHTPVPVAVRETLADADQPVEHETLVESVSDEADAGELAVEATIRRMRQLGEIFNATPDEDTAWSLP